MQSDRRFREWCIKYLELLLLVDAGWKRTVVFVALTESHKNWLDNQAGSDIIT